MDAALVDRVIAQQRPGAFHQVANLVAARAGGEVGGDRLVGDVVGGLGGEAGVGSVVPQQQVPVADAAMEA